MCALRLITFAQDHPTGAGHFPGNPIIPGAVLLDEIAQAVDRNPTLIKAAKFLHPVRPGETIEIDWQEQANGEIKFSCTLAASKIAVLTGVLT